MWFFYVETAGVSLEEMDRIFEIKHAHGSAITYAQATLRAKEDVQAEREQLSRQDLAEKERRDVFTEDIHGS